MANIQEVNMDYLHERFEIAKKYAKSEEERIAYIRGFAMINDAVEIQEDNKQRVLVESGDV